MRRMVVVAAVVAGLGLAAARPSTQARPGGPGTELLDGRPVASGEVLVKLRTTAAPADLGAIARLADADLVESLGQARIRRLRSRSQSTRALLARLAGHPGIVYVEPNFVVTALAEPGDPLMPYLWGLRNTGQAVNGGIAGQPGADVNAIGAWDVSIGSDAHVVAVIDTGLDYTPPTWRRTSGRRPRPSR